MRGTIEIQVLHFWSLESGILGHLTWRWNVQQLANMDSLVEQERIMHEKEAQFYGMHKLRFSNGLHAWNAQQLNYDWSMKLVLVLSNFSRTSAQDRCRAVKGSLIEGQHLLNDSCTPSMTAEFPQWQLYPLIDSSLTANIRISSDHNCFLL